MRKGYPDYIRMETFASRKLQNDRYPSGNSSAIQAKENRSFADWNYYMKSSLKRTNETGWDTGLEAEKPSIIRGTAARRIGSSTSVYRKLTNDNDSTNGQPLK